MLDIHLVRSNPAPREPTAVQRSLTAVAGHVGRAPSGPRSQTLPIELDALIAKAMEEALSGRISRAHIIAERSKRWYFLRPATIDFVEANGNYVNLCVGSERYISRDTLKRLQAELADVGFVRIRRNLLVNLARVDCAEKLPHGVVAFSFPGGERVLSGVGCKLESLVLQTISRPQFSQDAC